MALSLNYPDLLGFVTDGARLNIGPAQIAAAIRPVEPRAGQVIHVVVLVQNAADVDIDLTITISPPEMDVRKQRHKFTAKTQRVLVGIKAAEVGTLTMPVMTLPDTTPGQGYVIGVELEAKTVAKGGLARQPNGGGLVDADYLPPKALEALNELKTLTYITEKRGTRRLDLTFDLLPPKLHMAVDTSKAGWHSIAKLEDYKDPRLALYKYADLLTLQLLPRLKGDTMFPALTAATTERFAQGGYPLREVEAKLIARLMTLILEYAAPKETQHGFVAAGTFNIRSWIEKDPRLADSALELPRWFLRMLSAIGQDERVVTAPERVIPKFLYFDLLHDATRYGFELVEKATGLELGMPKEIDEYAVQNAQYLQSGSGMDYSRAYLPLVMAGALINDRMVFDKEDPAALIRELASVIEERVFEISEADMPVYEMAKQIIGQSGHKFRMDIEE